MNAEKKQKNILITTLGYTQDHLEPEYYSYRDENGDMKFCSGISGAEAGAKYILSKNCIDRIIVIGAPNAGGKKMSEAENSLDAFAGLAGRNPEDASEFEFFCYRLQQYMDRIDIESDDIINFDAAGKQHELDDIMNRDLKNGQKGLFCNAATDAEAYSRYLSVIAKMKDDREIRRLRHMMYLRMDSSYKMHALESNEAVKVRFIPVEKNDKDGFSVQSMVNVVNEIVRDSDGGMNIHIDLQGMDKTDSYTIWSMLLIRCSSSRNLKLQTIIRSRAVPDSFINSIDNEVGRYDIEILLSGMRAFVQYGKVELLEEYCSIHGIHNRQITNFINAMKYVDTGVSLCNLSDLQYGIQALKSIFRKADLQSENDQDDIVFTILRDGIRQDYGALLDGDEVNIPELVAWALRKHFYQQALTIIESLVPIDMVRRGIYYYAKTPQDIQDLLKNWNVLYWNELPRNRYTYNDPDHYFIKFYGRSIINFRQAKDGVARDYAKVRVEQLRGKYKELAKAYSGIKDEHLLYELLLSYYTIGDLRNQVSHALATEHALPDLEEMKKNDSFEQLGTAIERFLAMYRTACAGVDPSKEASLMLGDGELRAYTAAHRLQTLSAQDEGLLQDNTYDCQFNGKEVTINIRMLKVQDDNDPPEK